jgi:hypothetical protein
MKKRDARYYRKREQAELERAVHSKHNSVRRAHLGLADLYRRELRRLELLAESHDDEKPN